MLMIRQIIKPDDGLVGIIVTILVIGLIIVVTGIIQSVYVPQWLEQKEAEHMQIVSYQFAQLKQSLDIFSVIEQKNAISIYITLGTSETPIFGGGKTFFSRSFRIGNYLEGLIISRIWSGFYVYQLLFSETLKN